MSDSMALCVAQPARTPVKTARSTTAVTCRRPLSLVLITTPARKSAAAVPVAVKILTQMDQALKHAD